MPDRSHTDALLEFLQRSPSPYHAVANVSAMLDRAGFSRYDERESWAGRTGGGYVVRGGALVAWNIPDGAPPFRGFRIVGSHTDSPNLRVKPRPDTGAAGWRQVAVEIYGGPLINSWLDRDLGVSGRLVLRDGAEHLVQADQALLRVPQLAIHLDRQVNEGLTLDKQLHVTPVWGLGKVDEGDLVAFLADEAGIEPSQVTGWDLMLHDVVPPTYLGRDRELIAAPRMDNLLSVHAGATAFASAAADGQFIPIFAAFDHEESGSESSTGAGGPMLRTILERLVALRGGQSEDLARALAASICLSSDMGHAVHPNYQERHEPGHHPMVNGGPILKVNVNQRYATDGEGRAIWAAACERAGVPWQSFVSRNSIPCGTTIGPITAARLGITTVDVGIAALSMHSIRELAGAADAGYLASAIGGFYSAA